MTAESSRRFPENHSDIILPLKNVLRKNGLDVPYGPNPDGKIPRRWLLRGESNKDRLVDSNQRNFRPQFGQMGSYGVFLGDCLTPLMYYNPGAYYLFDRDVISADWVRIPSESYIEKIKSIGKEYNLAIEKVSDGLTAETIFFAHSVTYQPITGIVTLPYPLGLDKAHAIFLSSDLLSSKELDSLPNTLKGKITIF